MCQQKYLLNKLLSYFTGPSSLFFNNKFWLPALNLPLFQSQFIFKKISNDKIEKIFTWLYLRNLSQYSDGWVCSAWFRADPSNIEQLRTWKNPSFLINLGSDRALKVPKCKADAIRSMEGRSWFAVINVSCLRRENLIMQISNN